MITTLYYMNLIIKHLSADLIEDYLYFFDNMLFTEHPDWSKCYCYSYHFTGTNDEWTKENNRAAVIKLIRDNKMRGYLAYDGDQVVGWCNANDKLNFQSFAQEELGNKKICSIVCFLMDPAYRRKGIAQKILQQICLDYKDKGYEYIEAYPRKEDHSCEKNYHGHPGMYEKNDFAIVSEKETFFIVRKQL